MKQLLLVLFLSLLNLSFSQKNDSIPICVGKVVIVQDKDFINQYNRLKPTVLKVYPYALYAADLLDQMNNDLASIEKRRKRNKYANKSYKKLKEEYKYVFLDMYVSEGKVLTKLVARETGTTIYQIIKKYRGRKDAAMFNLMGKMFEQNLKANYNPKNERVLEAIIRDIESGKIKFDDTVVKLDKAIFKKKKKETKAKIKANHKKAKAFKKANRKKKRKAKQNKTK